MLEEKNKSWQPNFTHRLHHTLFKPNPFFMDWHHQIHEKNIKQTYYYYVNTNKSDIALFHRTTNLQLFMCIFKFNKSSNDILNDNFFFLKKIKMKLKNSNIHLGIWAVCYIHNLWIFNIISLIKYWKSCVKLLLYVPILQLTALSFCILCHGLGPD